MGSFRSAVEHARCRGSARAPPDTAPPARYDSRMRISIAILVFIALLVVPTRAEEALEETWGRIHLQGSPAGHVHTVVRRIESPDGPRLQTTSRSELTINRMGSVLEVVSTDQGPGIADLEVILSGLYQSRTGMGIGLLGTKRLMDEFEIDTRPGAGTEVRAVMYPD